MLSEAQIFFLGRRTCLMMAWISLVISPCDFSGAGFLHGSQSIFKLPCPLVHGV